MYAAFFGLRELPFNNTPDPRFFFATPEHEEALASLIYSVQERKGFVLLTGEVGAGKTLVARMLVRRLGRRITFATIHHAVRDARDLFESIFSEFDLPLGPKTSHAQMIRALHDFLLERFADNRPVVLIVDEAQSLSVETFEELRMIGNLEADDAKLLQVVLLGQPELQEIFESPRLKQLRQRTFCGCHLGPLSREQTEAYMLHRLGVAGPPRSQVFDSASFGRIHKLSRGIPRLINAICDAAMLSAYAAQQPRISPELVASAARQMLLLPMEITSRADAIHLSPQPRTDANRIEIHDEQRAYQVQQSAASEHRVSVSRENPGTTSTDSGEVAVQSKIPSARGALKTPALSVPSKALTGAAPSPASATRRGARRRQHPDAWAHTQFALERLSEQVQRRVDRSIRRLTALSREMAFRTLARTYPPGRRIRDCGPGAPMQSIRRPAITIDSSPTGVKRVTTEPHKVGQGIVQLGQNLGQNQASAFQATKAGTQPSTTQLKYSPSLSGLEDEVRQLLHAVVGKVG